MECQPLHFAAVPVCSNVEIAPRVFQMRFRLDALAKTVIPGQFFMVRIAGQTDPLIGRAFALYDTTDAGEVDFAYLVAGNLTTQLQRLGKDDLIEVWGPLGNGFPRIEADHLLMVAGGIGYTPFLAVAKQHLGLAQYGDPSVGKACPPPSKVSLCYGARTGDALAGVNDFEQIGVAVHPATDDGSRGHHGPVTEPLIRVLDEKKGEERVAIYCCGPEPMMHAVCQIAESRSIACFVSLESPMACGIGICFSCVAPIRTSASQPASDGQPWDYQRTCIDGPVFRADQIAWEVA